MALFSQKYRSKMMLCLAVALTPKHLPFCHMLLAFEVSNNNMSVKTRSGKRMSSHLATEGRLTHTIYLQATTIHAGPGWVRLVHMLVTASLAILLIGPIVKANFHVNAATIQQSNYHFPPYLQNYTTILIPTQFSLIGGLLHDKYNVRGLYFKK